MKRDFQKWNINFVYPRTPDRSERRFISLLLNHILILFFRTHVSRESAARLLPFALGAPEILLINAINLEIRRNQQTRSIGGHWGCWGRLGRQLLSQPRPDIASGHSCPQVLEAAVYSPSSQVSVSLANLEPIATRLSVSGKTLPSFTASST